MIKKKEDELSFENALHKLEELVQQLESGELNLEKSLQAFEEGMKLAKVCEEKLGDATTRVEKIMKDFSGKEQITQAQEDDHDF